MGEKMEIKLVIYRGMKNFSLGSQEKKLYKSNTISEKEPSMQRGTIKNEGAVAGMSLVSEGKSERHGGWTIRKLGDEIGEK